MFSIVGILVRSLLFVHIHSGSNGPMNEASDEDVSLMQ